MVNTIKKLPSGVKFFLIILLIYIVTGIFNSDYAGGAFGNFVSSFVQIIPILLLVFFVMFLGNLFIKPETIKRHLGHDSGFKGFLYAILGAMVIIGPPYLLFPLLGELKKHGMKNSLLVVFMNSRTVQPIFLPVMIYYFGLKFAVIISIYTFIFSILSGLAIERMINFSPNNGRPSNAPAS